MTHRPVAQIHALSTKQLQAQLKKLGIKQGDWAVALSGGPDSLALTALLAEIAPLTAFIVDHKLRAESTREAKAVHRMARKLDVKAHILSWQGDKPSTGVMAAARQARYELLVRAAQKHKCTHLFIAHHMDDQLETVTLRERAGSGWQGLAGMPVLAQLGNVTLVRPLLHVSKAQLVATCIERGLKAVDDPSNRNPKYARAQLRLEGIANAKATLAKQQKAATRRQALLDKIRAAEGKAYELHEGWASFVPKLATAPMLQLLLQYIGQEDKPIRQEALAELLTKVKAGQGATLAGCIVKNGLMTREPQAITPLALEAGRHHIWFDRRWKLSFTAREAYQLAPLGKNSNWRSLKNAKWLETITGAARPALPALWLDGRLVAVLKGEWLPYYHPMQQQFMEK